MDAHGRWIVRKERYAEERTCDHEVWASVYPTRGSAIEAARSVARTPGELIYVARVDAIVKASIVVKTIDDPGVT